MEIEIRQETADDLEAYGEVSIAFTADSRFRVEWLERGIGGVRLIEEPLEAPRLIDFDADKGVGPVRWHRFGDIGHWGFFAAYVEGRRAGGATVSYDTPGYGMLEGRTDLANLTDIRVDPKLRHQGVGAALFRHAVTWLQASAECRRLKIETQNTNPRACRFYAAQGARLGGIQPLDESPDEFELDLFWYLELG
jgi:ribosomal protein S18 acetylase RimI-like enzyme